MNIIYIFVICTNACIYNVSVYSGLWPKIQGGDRSSWRGLRLLVMTKLQRDSLPSHLHAHSHGVVELASTPCCAQAIFLELEGLREVENFDSGRRHHTVVSPAQSEDGLGTAFLRAARAKEEEFDAMRHERRSDIKLPSHNQGSKKACLSGAEV